MSVQKKLTNDYMGWMNGGVREMSENLIFRDAVKCTVVVKRLPP